MSDVDYMFRLGVNKVVNSAVSDCRPEFLQSHTQ